MSGRGFTRLHRLLDPVIGTAPTRHIAHTGRRSTRGPVVATHRSGRTNRNAFMGSPSDRPGAEEEQTGQQARCALHPSAAQRSGPCVMLAAARAAEPTWMPAALPRPDAFPVRARSASLRTRTTGRPSAKSLRRRSRRGSRHRHPRICLPPCPPDQSLLIRLGRDRV